MFYVPLHYLQGIRVLFVKFSGLWDGCDFYSDRASGMGDVLLQLAHAQDTIRQKSRWELFCQTVEQIVPIKEIAIPLKPRPDMTFQSGLSDNNYLTIADFKSGGEQDRLVRWGRVGIRADICRLVGNELLPLSSGQLTFIRFAANVCLHIENGTMVLFDEPETHLHPNLIADFIRLLDRLLSETGSFAILATHSAYLVREVPRSQVMVLRESRPKTIEVAPVRLRTLGADVGAISAFVFEEEPHGFLITELGKRLVAEGKHGVEMLKSLERELPAEAVMHLRKTLNAENEM